MEGLVRDWHKPQRRFRIPARTVLPADPSGYSRPYRTARPSASVTSCGREFHRLITLCDKVSHFACLGCLPPWGRSLMGQGSPDALDSEQRPGWGGVQGGQAGVLATSICTLALVEIPGAIRQVLTPHPPTIGPWRCAWWRRDANPSPHGTMVGTCPRGGTLALSGFTLRHAGDSTLPPVLAGGQACTRTRQGAPDELVPPEGALHTPTHAPTDTSTHLCEDRTAALPSPTCSQH